MSNSAPNRLSSLDHAPETTGFQVDGEAAGIFRALIITFSSTGRISGNAGIEVKEGRGSFSYVKDAIKATTGSGVGRGAGRDGGSGRPGGKASSGRPGGKGRRERVGRETGRVEKGKRV
jgi:hypothetical protein